MHQHEVKISTPCDVEFDTLERRATGRFCHHCRKLVHDLSSLTETRARELLTQADESLCVRYLHDVTGEIHFSDSAPVPVSNLTKNRRSVALAFSVAPLLMQACGGADFAREPSPNCDTSNADSDVSNARSPAVPGSPTAPSSTAREPSFTADAGAAARADADAEREEEAPIEPPPSAPAAGALPCEDADPNSGPAGF